MNRTLAARKIPRVPRLSSRVPQLSSSARRGVLVRNGEPRSWGAKPAFIGGVVLLATTAALVSPSHSRADEGEQEPQTQPASALAERQEIVKDRVGRLEDRMFQLSQALRTSEPDKAGRLLEGLGELRGRQIREKLDEIIATLEARRYSDAVDLQQKAAADLEALLKLLLEDPDNLQERKEELQRLEAIRKELEKLIAEQEREKADAESARLDRKLAEDLEAAAAELRELIPRQKDLADTARARQAAANELAKQQAGLRSRTEALAKDVSDILDAMPPESGETDNQSAGATPASSGPDGDLQNAAEKMQSAERALMQEAGTDAPPLQDNAAQDLERALEKIETRAENLRDRLEFDEQAEAQQETAEKSKALLQDMKGGSSGDASGGQAGGENQDGQPAEQQGSESNAPTPGQSGVEQAIPFQEEAADELKQKDADEAIEKQAEALEKLKQAKDDLEDRLDQLRKEQQEELLAQLESRFRAMLARQTECNKGTNRLAEIGSENWKRSDQLEFADLSGKQRWVADQADEALFLLVEEGTTTVLPQLVEHVRDDARELADRLAAADAGPAVVLMQQDLVQLLQDILDAIKRKQEELQSGQGGGGGNSPLLPGSAELKLLRACQLRVNQTTLKLEESKATSDAHADQIESAAKRLSDRQAEVAEMAKDMHEAMNRAQ